MPTDKPRINLTFERQTSTLLKQMARRHKKSVAGLARDLVLESLDRHEDIALLRLAEQSEKDQKGKKLHSYKEVREQY